MCFILLLASAFFFLLQQKTSYAGTTPPTTTETFDPSSPDGRNGWYVSPLDITLEATDLESGVKEINYRLNSGSWIKTEFGNTLNLAPNPSFEVYGVIAPLHVADWGVVTPGDPATFTRTITEYAPGAAIYSVEIGSTTPGWHAIQHKEDFAVVTPFSNMSASAQIKTVGANLAYFKMYAVSLDGFGQPVYTQLSQSTTLSGTNDWTQVDSNFVVSLADAIGVFMEVGLDGAGTIYVDAITITESYTTAQVNFVVGADGSHTLEWYSVDRMGNTESTHSRSFKIDQTPPGKWYNAGAFRGLFGTNYMLWVYVNVQDDTSGISTFTDKYQYHVDAEPGFGRYDDILDCGSDWEPDGWVILISPPFLPGVKSAYLLTPKTNFCNDNWRVCKKVKFHAEDMAGNINEQDFCINGPWIKFRGEGIIGSTAGIDMISEPEDDNTDGLVEIGNDTLDFFRMENDWNIKNYNLATVFDYDTLWDMTSSKTEITDGNLVSEDGVYNIDGNFEINSSSTPSDYDSNTFNQIVFINGDLLISEDIMVNNSSTAFFVVSGDVEIAKIVENVGIAILADEEFKTAYDIEEGDATEILNLNGVYGANKFVFQRTLQGTNNNDVPSENFVYEPKYLIGLKDFFEGGSIKWLDSN